MCHRIIPYLSFATCDGRDKAISALGESQIKIIKLADYNDVRLTMERGDLQLII